jgi:hypothetical protein
MSKRTIVAIVIVLMLLYALFLSGCARKHYLVLYKDRHHVHLMGKDNFEEVTIKRRY